MIPPGTRAWLPEGHLAWFVLDPVAQMDLAAFFGAYRQDGHGRPAFDRVFSPVGGDVGVIWAA